MAKELNPVDEVSRQIARHDRDIAGIKTDLAALTQDVKHLDVSLKEAFSEIKQFMTAHPARSGVSLNTIAKVLQIAAYGAALVGATVTTIVYVASNSNAVEIALMRERLSHYTNGPAAPEPHAVRVLPAKR